MIKRQFSGFTLLEVSVAIAMMGVLVSLVWMNILSSREKASQATSIDILLSDLRSQQLKAMVGDTEGRIAHDAYGILLGTTSYTLFHGASFAPADPANFTVNLKDNERFQNILFPNSTINFASVSGEIVGFSLGNNSFVIQNIQNNEQKTIRLNKYGVVSYIN